MKKVIRLTENELIKVIRKIVKEQSSSSVKQFELFTDPNLRNSIGTYLFAGAESAMGGKHTVFLKPTSSSKIKCLKTFDYRMPMINIFSGQIALDPYNNPGCNVPKTLYTNDAGEDILKDE